jgi:hypothetical protein
MSVPIAEIRSDVRQPDLLEKKTNIGAVLTTRLLIRETIPA